MGKLLRKVHGWRFEIPLALVLGAAAGFAASVMPTTLFQRVPVVGDLGFAGQAGLALVLGLLCGWGGYAVMRGPAPAKAAEEIDEEPVEDEAAPERLRRFRRADFHPDAPPRAPIRAHRDLGEPFMEVSAFTWPSDEPPALDAAEPAHAIPEAEFVEVAEDAAFAAVASPEETVSPEPVVAEPVVVEMDPAADEGEVQPAVVASVPPVEMVRAEPVVPPSPRIERPSLAEMIDRLSAGLERRVREAERTAPPLPPRQPPRDMGPALRDALEELNRLAARRD